MGKSTTTDSQHLESDIDLDRKEKLKNIFAKIYISGYTALGHGTSQDIADKILINGLESANRDLTLTALTLFDYNLPYNQQSNATQDNFLNSWPHRDYKRVVIIQCPNPGEDQINGRTYFDSIFEELPDDKKVELAIQGFDKRWVIPSHFIQGYVDLETMTFVKNPNYNPPKQLEVKIFNGNFLGLELTDMERTRDEILNIPLPDSLPTPDPLNNDVW